MSTVLIQQDATDKDAVARAVRDQWSLDGYMVEDEEGNLLKDRASFLEAIYARVVSARADSSSDRSRVSLTRGNLTSLIFPSAPGAEPGSVTDLDEFQAAVWKKLDGEVFAATNPAVRKGAIQRMLGERREQNGGLVLIREKYAKEQDEVWVTYTTADEELILAKNLGPMRTKLVNSSDEFGFQSFSIIERLPNLEGAVTREASSTTKAISKVVKTQLALAATTVTPEPEAQVATDEHGVQEDAA